MSKDDDEFWRSYALRDRSGPCFKLFAWVLGSLLIGLLIVLIKITDWRVARALARDKKVREARPFT